MMKSLRWAALAALGGVVVVIAVLVLDAATRVQEVEVRTTSTTTSSLTGLPIVVDDAGKDAGDEDDADDVAAEEVANTFAAEVKADFFVGLGRHGLVADQSVLCPEIPLGAAVLRLRGRHAIDQGLREVALIVLPAATSAGRAAAARRGVIAALGAKDGLGSSSPDPLPGLSGRPADLPGLLVPADRVVGRGAPGRDLAVEVRQPHRRLLVVAVSDGDRRQCRADAVRVAASAWEALAIATRAAATASAAGPNRYR